MDTARSGGEIDLNSTSTTIKNSSGEKSFFKRAGKFFSKHEKTQEKLPTSGREKEKVDDNEYKQVIDSMTQQIQQKLTENRQIKLTNDEIILKLGETKVELAKIKEESEDLTSNLEVL